MSFKPVFKSAIVFNFSFERKSNWFGCSMMTNRLKINKFAFSKIEFEPGFILNMLQMNYALPQGSQYQLFLENIRAYYKTSEKWILKGYAPGESDRENDDSVSKFDAGKIINVDFRTQ